MTATDAPTPAATRVVPDMFRGPRRLSPFLPLLRALPAPLSRRLIVGLALSDAALRGRFREASAWAAAQGTRGIARWRLALTLVANHGRFVAEEAMIGISDVEAVGRAAVVEGAERLAGLRTGALLLGFHLGPPRTAFVLRSLGYPVRLTGRLESAREDARWNDALAAEEAVRLPAGAPAERAEALQRIRRLVRDGAMVYMAADGPFGREAFRITLPGRPMILRAGWFTLRRISRAPTFPVTTYADGRRRVIVVHPPLPEPDADQSRDIAACHTALTSILEDYVRRYPGQCRYLAFPQWSAPDEMPDR